MLQELAESVHATHALGMSIAASRSSAIAPAYVRAAHTKAVFGELRRYLLDRLPRPSPMGVDEDCPQILAEEAPYTDRFVPDKVVESVLRALARLESEALEEMGSFQMIKQAGAKPPRPARRSRP